MGRRKDGRDSRQPGLVGRLPVCNPLRQVAAQACAVRNAVGPARSHTQWARNLDIEAAWNLHSFGRPSPGTPGIENL